jgi:hypothetical protein
MAEPVSGRMQRRPAQRLRAKDHDGYFFPGEVVAMLGLQAADYQQMRRLFRLVREQSGVPVNTGWSRYNLIDVAAMRVLVSLCGGAEALTPGRRLRVECIRTACSALRRLGIENPLLDVRLRRVGDRVYADLDGSILDPVSGQIALAEAFTLARRSVKGEQLSDQLTERLGDERRRKSGLRKRDLGTSVGTHEVTSLND